MNVVSRYTVEEFGHDVRQLLDANGAGMESILRLGHLLQRFGGENSRDYFWSVGEPATIRLPACPGRSSTTTRTASSGCCSRQYPPDTPTAIHSHEGWVVIGLLEGSERYTSWRRVDDGSDAPRNAGGRAGTTTSCRESSATCTTGRSTCTGRPRRPRAPWSWCS